MAPGVFFFVGEHMNSLKRWWKWIVLFACFIVLEVAPGPTLSEAFWTGSATVPWLKWAALGFGVLVTGHLVFGWVKRWDPNRWGRSKGTPWVVLAAVVGAQACVPTTPPVTGPTTRSQAVRVSTPAGAPIEGATVQIAQEKATTGADGVAAVSVTVPGRFAVSVEHACCVAYRDPYDLTRDTPTIPITLVAKPPVPDPVRRPTPAEVRNFRGLLGNDVDAEGIYIWTPALPGATPAKRREWLTTLAARGATHIPIGPFDAGPVYLINGRNIVPWENPDWTRNPAAIRGLVLEILNTPSQSGAGLVPVIFFDNGSPNPGPRLSVIRATLSAALEGIGEYTWTGPCGWESYEWRARECYDADRAWFPMRQGSLVFWHGWQDRSNGASNPGQADDPWLGDPGPDGKRYGEWFRFWDDSHFEAFLYQSRPIRTIAEARCGKVQRTEGAKTGWAFPESCWKSDFLSAVSRVGAAVCADMFGDGSPCGPGRKLFVFFESVAYFTSRGVADPGVGDVVATEAAAICRQFGVECGFGNGLPR